MAATCFRIEGSDAVFGPLPSAVMGARQLQQGERATCWKEKPSWSAEGTVLVQHVDVRLPLEAAGEWRASPLLTPSGSMCGGVVYRLDAVADEPAAAELLRRMEDAGGVPVTNFENDEVLAQGVRYIGRYAWPEYQSKDDRLSAVISGDGYWKTFKGPEIVFAAPELMADEDYVMQLLAGTPTKQPELRLLRGPDGTARGVHMVFTGHEYLFGRLFFDCAGRVVAAAAYTYAISEYFGLLSVDRAPVCHLSGARIDPSSPQESLLAALRDLPPDQALGGYDALTRPLQHEMQSLLIQQYGTPCKSKKPAANRADALLRLLFDQRPTSIALSSVACGLQAMCPEQQLLLIDSLPEPVVTHLRTVEQQLYDRAERACRAGSCDNGNFDPASVLSVVAEPESVAALLRKGFSPHRALGQQQRRSLFEQVAAEGEPDVLSMLIEHGASVDDDSLDGRWNAIAYAVHSGFEDILQLLSDRWPDHPAWHRRYPPLPKAYASFGGHGDRWAQGKEIPLIDFVSADSPVVGILRSLPHPRMTSLLIPALSSTIRPPIGNFSSSC